MIADLDEARESLRYWESRLERLPLHAVRRRREARTMAARWRERVRAAERARYGAGLLGALFMVLAERRLPEDTRITGRRLVRTGAAIGAAVAVFLVALLVVAGAAAIEILRAVF